MAKKQYVSDLRPKDDVADLFLVKYIAVMEGRDGRNYLNLVLSDASGDLEARKWSDAQETLNAIPKGSYVQVSGKINAYQGRHQLIVQDIAVAQLPAHYSQDDFVPKVDGDVAKMFGHLMELVEKLDDYYIRQLLLAVLHDHEIAERLQRWHAGKSIHHAYQGGLLEHVLSCARLAGQLADYYAVNRNFVVAGAILHDLCKVYELSDGPLVEYTDEGKLVGHLAKSIQLLEYFTTRMGAFPQDTKDHLLHILLAHHGEYEFGSPKVPQTSEAMLVHLIDLMDSRMNSFDIVKKSDRTPGEWSGFVKHLDRMIFKGAMPFYATAIGTSGDSNKKNRNASGETKELKQSLASKLAGLKIEGE